MGPSVITQTSTTSLRATVIASRLVADSPGGQTVSTLTGEVHRLLRCQFVCTCCFLVNVLTFMDNQYVEANMASLLKFSA